MNGTADHAAEIPFGLLDFWTSPELVVMLQTWTWRATPDTLLTVTTVSLRDAQFIVRQKLFVAEFNVPKVGTLA